MQHEAPFGANRPAVQDCTCGGRGIDTFKVQLFEDVAQASKTRGLLMTMPKAPSSVCSQIRVTVVEKFGSAMPGIAISKWLFKESILAISTSVPTRS